MIKLIKRWKFKWLLTAGVNAALFTAATLAQTTPPIQVNSYPTGLKPAGLAYGAGPVVANSGDNSLSFFQGTSNPQLGQVVFSPSKVVSGIPGPYALAVCYRFSLSDVEQTLVLATSPSDNSVTVVQIPDATVVAKIKVGLQPYSVACSPSAPGQAIVSNFGDSTLMVIDLNSLTVTSTIAGIPGSRGLHGVAVNIAQIGGQAVPQAWVAVSDANVLTIVDLTNSHVVASFPIQNPINVRVTCVTAASGMVCINPSTLQVTISAIPNVLDFVSAYPLGDFEILGSLGGATSLALFSGNTPTVVPQVTNPADMVSGAIFQCGSGGIPPPCTTVGSYLLVTSADSNNLFLIQTPALPPSLPSDFVVGNGASYARGTAAPGSLLSAFASTGVSQNFFTSSIPLPSTLGGVTLRVGGTLNLDTTSNKWTYSPTGSVPAPLSFVSPTQINFQIPPGTSLGNSVPAQLTKPDGSTLLTTLNVVATAPGIFSLLMNGQGQGAVLNQDYSLNFGTNPAPRGGVIQIYATGAGATNPPMLPGEAAPVSGNPLVFTQVQPTVTVGGISARVFYSIMAPGFPGVWQVDAEVPQNVVPGFAVPLVISAGGVTSNTVTIAVQ